MPLDRNAGKCIGQFCDRFEGQQGMVHQRMGNGDGFVREVVCECVAIFDPDQSLFPAAHSQSKPNRNSLSRARTGGRLTPLPARDLGLRRRALFSA